MYKVTINPQVMGGIPCVIGTRVPVSFVLNILAHEPACLCTVLEIYEHLSVNQVREALLWAADAMKDCADAMKDCGELS